MRLASIRLILIYAGIFISAHNSGQINLRGFDSIPVNKPARLDFIYEYDHNGPKEIHFQEFEPVIVQNDAKNPVIRDIGHGVLTVVTGIGWGSSTNIYWKFGSVIKCNDALPDWRVNLFCEGKQEKERNRVRDSDGSFNVETETTNTYNWDKNATGLITEGNDTLGSFLIIMNPREDSLLKPFSDYVFSQKPNEFYTVLNNKWYFKRLMYTGFDYGVVGKFHDKNFSIISNNTARKTWFFSEDEINCIFQPDLDDIAIRKKDRIMPYLLINKKIPDTERTDLFRLAIMSRYLSTTLQ